MYSFRGSGIRWSVLRCSRPLPEGTTRQTTNKKVYPVVREVARERERGGKEILRRIITLLHAEIHSFRAGSYYGACTFATLSAAGFFSFYDLFTFELLRAIIKLSNVVSHSTKFKMRTQPRARRKGTFGTFQREF